MYKDTIFQGVLNMCQFPNVCPGKITLYKLCTECHWRVQNYKQAPRWAKLCVHTPWSIWVIVAKFHTISLYRLTDFQSVQNDVTNVSYQHFLLIRHRARHLRHACITPLCWTLLPPDFISPQYWPQNSPDLNPVDYTFWVYGCRIRDVNHLKERLIEEWHHFDHSIIDTAVDQ